MTDIEIDRKMEIYLFLLTEPPDDGSVSCALNSRGEVIWLANYLDHPQFGNYRLQAYKTMPIIVMEALIRGSNDDACVIRNAIDEGLPLIKLLSTRWQINPSVIKFLLTLDYEKVLDSWKGTVRSLAHAISYVPCECYPDTIREEDAFIESLQGEYSWDDEHKDCPSVFLAMATWSKYVLIDRRVGENEKQEDGILKERYYPMDNMRRVIKRLFIARDMKNTDRYRKYLNSAYAYAVDDYLLSLDHKYLSRQAERYQRSFKYWASKIRMEDGYRARIHTWPLIPKPFISSDGTRLIRPLTKYKTIRQHGKPLKQCIKDFRVAWEYYSYAGQMKIFILAVIDLETKRPISTICVSPVWPQYEDEMFELKLVEHTADRNNPPSSECILACEELIKWCHTSPVANHILAGRSLLHEYQDQSNAYKLKDDLHDEAETRALVETFDEDGLEALLGEMCAKLV